MTSRIINAALQAVLTTAAFTIICYPMLRLMIAGE